MNVNSKKARIALALSSDAPGIVNYNIANVYSADAEKLINTNLRDFEIGLPNPVGRINLTDSEFQEALQTRKSERLTLENEAKRKKIEVKEKWMSIKLMEKFEYHQANYRKIIFEDAPLLAVIERPESYDQNNNPLWSQQQFLKAFDTIDDHIKKIKTNLPPTSIPS
jgi:hypothetical protein